MKINLQFDFKTGLRWLLAAILVWAALSKIANLHEFYAAILAYQVPVADALARWVAMVLPWLELLCGLLLLAGSARRAALAWTVLMFGLFVLATGQAWWRGLDISCGCFKLGFLGDGSLAKFVESVKFACVRAVLLMGVSLYLLRASAPVRAVVSAIVPEKPGPESKTTP
jgi:uncharacterized membrane protein YphA (DoxX/SURF4 family)